MLVIDVCPVEKSKMNLIRTRLELESAWKIIGILEEERKLYSHAVMRPRPNLDSAEVWTQVPVSRGYRQCNTTPPNSQIQRFTTSNRFSPLQESEDRRKKTEERRTSEVKCVVKAPGAKVVPKAPSAKHKLIVIGDSHARGCASELNANSKNRDTVA